MQYLALIEAPDHVCSRYRIAPFRGGIEKGGGSLTIEALERSPVARTIQLANAARFDAVILQRKLLPAWQLLLLRKSARRLVFDFDDAVVYRDSNDPRGPQCPRRGARFARLMRLADGVIAGNSFLAELAEKAGARHDRIQIIPTCIRTEAYPVRFEQPASDGLCLTWVGSSGTLSGLERERALWQRVGREIPGARLKVICDRFPNFDPLPVESVRWNEQTEAAELARSDAGISWIPDDLWSRGKCGLKVLQFMAAGLPVLANPVGVHPEMIAPGRTGELPRSHDDWLAAARELAGNPERRLEWGRAARDVVERRYSVAAWSDVFAAFVRGSSPSPKPHVAPRPDSGVTAPAPPQSSVRRQG